MQKRACDSICKHYMMTVILCNPGMYEMNSSAQKEESGVSATLSVAIGRRRAVIAGLVALAVGGAGVAWVLAPPRTQVTDNAYVGADATAVAPKVRGLVAKVLVQDNQIVHAGAPLVRIDTEEFDARVASAVADLADAQAGVAAADAALVSLAAEERLARANIHAAQAAIPGAQEQAGRTAMDDSRYANLVGSGAVAKSDADRFHAAAVDAAQDVQRVMALYDVAQNNLAVTQARRAGLQASLQKAEATRLRAAAALDLARQDQRHTVIVAPIDGIVGNRQVQPGDYVQPGTRLLTLVSLQERYVTANFKETQIEHMRKGQTARVELDALPGKVFLGNVESLAPGSGSRFALLPFEPGTGNFTKIVQRVPVRIRLAPGQVLDGLRPGLSASVTVALHG